MMDTLVSGVSKDILKISTDEFTLYLSGNSENKKFRATNNNKQISAKVSVVSNYDDIKVHTINSFGELELNEEDTMYPSFFEDGSYNIYLENDTENNFTIHHEDKDIRENIVCRRRDAHGSFKFNGDIGFSTFKILKNNKEVLNFTIQVFPSKLDYLDDYNDLLREVNEEVTSLVFEFISKTFSNIDIKDVKKQTNLEFIVILTNIYEKLEKSIKRIEKQPKHGVLTEYNFKDKNKAKRTSTKETIKHLRKNHTSKKVVEMKKRTTLDIYENQYVKYILKRILKKIKSIKVQITKSKGMDNPYYRKLNEIEGRLAYHLNTFFRDISDLNNNKSMTLVFKMASGYKEVYYYYNLLSKGLDICTGLYDVSHKKLWNLYEIWCYIKIHNIIQELGYTAKDSTIIQTTNNGLTLSLMQSKKAKCIYENIKGEKLELWYNKPYNALPTTSQRPDTVLCLKGDKTSDRVYIFDAKYRIYVSDNGAIGPMEEDINVMHRYRDSIVSENELEDYYKYETFGAYVMFPCSDETTFENHKYYKSIDKVNIGAIPMLPGSTSLMKKHICKIIDESYIEAVNNNPIFDESEDYYRFKNQNVMVVNTKDKKHFEAYKQNKFYHIPKEELSKLKLGVEYLAFYQSKKEFGKEHSGIFYIAKINNIYEYNRGDCKELESKKNKSNDIYLRFELDTFESIRSISSVEYAPPLLSYTTMYLLKKASTIHELKLKNRTEIEVYKVLKKYSEKYGIILKKENEGFYIGNSFVKVLENRDIKLNDSLVTIKELIEILNRN
ncbi:DUF2357 domain-containing protein [Romboutsia sp.]|uniref:DUF2357 domain-containing protein n=1 Tax=Romboutsia sp. TaxID=1965302 RepID=UPI003F2A6B3E